MRLDQAASLLDARDRMGEPNFHYYSCGIYSQGLFTTAKRRDDPTRQLRHGGGRARCRSVPRHPGGARPRSVVMADRRLIDANALRAEASGYISSEYFLALIDAAPTVVPDDEYKAIADAYSDVRREWLTRPPDRTRAFIEAVDDRIMEYLGAKATEDAG